MDKRYQVFVSSTYVDLKEERQKVLQTLMEMDCIPAGMELFPAADEEQWEFIQRVIDDCDYYLLIIGGRYGSIADNGLSYTEKEFDYAVSKGIKVIALLHDSPELLPRAKTEKSEELERKLNKFREKVSSGRLVRFWSDPRQLPGEVALSLNKTIKIFPSTGWVRANLTASPDLLIELNNLRKLNDSLKLQLENLNRSSFIIPLSDLADWHDSINITGTYSVNASSINYEILDKTWKTETTWSKLFSIISPYLTRSPHENLVSNFIATEFNRSTSSKLNASDFKVDQQVLFSIRVQFIALSFISIDRDGNWLLTEAGNNKMIESRVSRRVHPEELST
ncbi:DUF4062 domain-containing protein [Microbulbifer sp. MLAF003]|uniref:DUF4062 domain-containing protein n=1 Tax=Microbulbifer sp. MLAF003 TaxID=3032582 RepID=UPI0024ADDCE3|nr:DUF4062 domain-containing protein [Microbulbifer sp. MLAF003]WHI49690.1 DUF4062 domain-containing protein [Microbulbifer sp. MLAF003]